MYNRSVAEKPLAWLGSALDDLRAFPPDARREAGYQLRRVQSGVMPNDWKPMASVGTGVNEIRIHTRSEHRVIYVARFPESVYVLCAFEKRSRRTPRGEIELAKKRLSELHVQRGNR